MAQADLSEYAGKCVLFYSSYVSNQVFEVHTRKIKTTLEAEKARAPLAHNLPRRRAPVDHSRRARAGRVRHVRRLRSEQQGEAQRVLGDLRQESDLSAGALGFVVVLVYVRYG